MNDHPTCRFPHRDSTDAVIKVSVPDGCICYPNDHEQWLCWQHYDKMMRNGVEHEVLIDFRE